MHNFFEHLKKLKENGRRSWGLLSYYAKSLVEEISSLTSSDYDFLEMFLPKNKSRIDWFKSLSIPYSP